VGCESALRQAETSESSGGSVVEVCNNALVRIKWKRNYGFWWTQDYKRPDRPLWLTINTKNLEKNYKEEGRNAFKSAAEKNNSPIVKWYYTATGITQDSWKDIYSLIQHR